MAEVKASIELDKLTFYNRDLYQELQDQKPNFELLFEKNIPFSKENYSMSSVSSPRKSVKTARKNKNPKPSLLFDYEGPTIKSEQKVKIHNFRDGKRRILKKRRKTKKESLNDLLDLIKPQGMKKGKKKKRIIKKKRRNKLNSLEGELGICIFLSFKA
mmetsp:Transcript_5679/g.4893  ORF Transcript_5679/g.4893 Transcript_5679/m.4893 type:complete len:158 (+) Transcript_5679:315-788(+)